MDGQLSGSCRRDPWLWGSAGESLPEPTDLAQEAGQLLGSSSITDDQWECACCPAAPIRVAIVPRDADPGVEVLSQRGSGAGGQRRVDHHIAASGVDGEPHVGVAASSASSGIKHFVISTTRFGVCRSASKTSNSVRWTRELGSAITSVHVYSATGRSGA